jgi:hypothetical protein
MVAVEQHVGHLVLDDHARQPLGDRGLADAGLADVQRIVLAPAAQDLDGALDLELAADQRIDLALARRLVEVGRVLLERAAAAVAFALASAAAVLALLRSSPPALDRPCEMKLTTSRRETSCMLSRIHRVRLLLAEDRDQHVGDRDFLLAARLHVEHRPLQHALEAERRLHVALLAGRQARRRLVDELLQFGLQLGGIRAAGLQDLADLRRVDDREQQVLDGHEFMRASRAPANASFKTNSSS